MSPASRSQHSSPPADDPFPASARLGSYVALPSREQVLAYLSAKLTEAPGVVELCGPAGVGKSLLMRVLAERLGERFVAIHVPIPTLPPDELATWVRREGGGPGPGRPDRILQRLWNRIRTRSLPRLLLVDDAQELPEESVDWITAWCTENGACAVLAFTEEFGTRQSSAQRAFLEPLDLSEVAGYVECHLQRSGAPPEIRRLFEGDAGHSLALGSRGIPRAIHRLADERLLALAALNRGDVPSSAFPPPRQRPRPDAQTPAATRPRTGARGTRGYFMAGVASALFLGSLTLSVPSPLADGPERPPALLPRAEPSLVSFELVSAAPAEPAASRSAAPRSAR